MSRLSLLLLPLFACSLAGAQTKDGFMVRFLANLDTVTKYNVYRSNQAGTIGVKVGEVVPSGKDTLEFGDLDVVKGSPYFYSMTATYPSGLESDFSSQSGVAFPSLDLPDTLKAPAGVASVQFVLTAKNHPLATLAPLSLQIVGTSPFNFQYVEDTRTVTITSKAGTPEKSKVKVRASYYGEFFDEDSAVIVIATKGTGLADPGISVLAAPGSLRYGAEGTPIFSNLPAGELRIFTLQGATAFRKSFPQAQKEFPWAGNGTAAGSVGAQRFTYLVLDQSGRVSNRGRLLLSR